MTRDEEIDALVQSARKIIAEHNTIIAKILHPASDSYWYQEQIPALLAREQYMFELKYEPIWWRLLERIASEDRDGIRHLNPVNPNHIDIACDLIAREP